MSVREMSGKSSVGNTVLTLFTTKIKHIVWAAPNFYFFAKVLFIFFLFLCGFALLPLNQLNDYGDSAAEPLKLSIVPNLKFS